MKVRAYVGGWAGRFGLAASAGFVLLVGGCGAPPIPSVAIEGTTVTIPIPDQFEVGFGTVFTSDPDTSNPGVPAVNYSDPEEDLQRGELVFTLEDPNDPNFSMDIPVLWVGSAAPDPAATISDRRQRQVIALVNLPGDLVADGELAPKSFELKVNRYRRDNQQGNAFVPVRQHWFVDHNPSYTVDFSNLDWFGWGNDGGVSPDLVRIPIEIADAPEPDGSEPLRYTKRRGWGAYIYQNLSGVFPWSVTSPYFDEGNGLNLEEASLRNYRPSPEFEYVFSGYAYTSVAAADITIEFPNNRVEIVGVRPATPSPTGVTLMWNATPLGTPANSGGCNSGPPGELHVQLADPSNQTEGIVVMFELRNLATCFQSWGRLKATDLAVSTSAPPRLYLDDGSLIPLSPTVTLNLINSDLR